MPWFFIPLLTPRATPISFLIPQVARIS